MKESLSYLWVRIMFNLACS